MTETQFIEKNQDDWNELEKLLKNPIANSERLQQLFVKVSGDLAFASTYFPNRSVRVYLNLLTQRVFDSVSKKKSSISLQSFVTFFTESLPIELYRSRKALLFSFLFFIVMMGIGAISTAYHEDFARVVLSDAYVTMTEENINEGDPMAVYKDAEMTDMFLGITINNIRVSFLTYILGFFGSLGTIIILMFNGIMVGTFQFFFYQKGLFLTSFLTIWIHGTIEISAIIIAGAAGIVLGSGLIFPGTFTRVVSLQISAIRSLKILLSTVPLFVIAGFLESFITRQTELPTLVKASIIGASLLFILFIYWYYPRRVASKVDYNPNFYDTDRLPPKRNLEPIGSHSTVGILLRAITDYGASLGNLWSKWIGPTTLVYLAIMYVLLLFVDQDLLPFSKLHASYAFSAIAFTFVQFKVVVYAIQDNGFNDLIYKPFNRLIILIASFFTCVMITLMTVPTIELSILLIFFAIPIPVFYFLNFSRIGNKITNHIDSAKLGYAFYGRSLLMTLIILALYLVLYLLANSVIIDLFFEYIDMHDGITSYQDSSLLLSSLVRLIIVMVMIPIMVYSSLYSYIAYLCDRQGIDITLNLKSFGDEE